MFNAHTKSNDMTVRVKWEQAKKAVAAGGGHVERQVLHAAVAAMNAAEAATFTDAECDAIVKLVDDGVIS